jgi:hypothetical protein
MRMKSRDNHGMSISELMIGIHLARSIRGRPGAPPVGR